MPSPFIIEIAVEPADPADRANLSAAVQRLINDDASLAATQDCESGQTLLHGMEESRLNAAINQLQRDCDQRLNVGAPQVTYRENLARMVEMDYTHKKQSGGAGQFARIRFKAEPGKPGQGLVFEDATMTGNVAKHYIASVEQGIRQAAAEGSSVGFPVVDFTVTLYDCVFHDTDSSAKAFEIAARCGMREAAQKAGIILLEPIMRVEIVTPEDFLGDVIGDLNKRRGHIEGADSRGNARVVAAMVPLAKMFGYADHLRVLTQERAQYTMQLSHYAPAPDFDPDDSFPSAAALRAYGH